MPFATGIDHVIIAVQDLEAATATYRDLLGLHVCGGGVHPQFGTANRIIVLGDDYVELLSAQPGATPQGWIAGMLIGGGEGCAGFALGMTDPAGVAGALRAREVQVEGPAPGRLDAAGGYSRGWQTVRIGGTMGASLPFLILHDTAGEERRRLLAGPVGLAPQPLGARRVASVTVAVADLEAALATYQRCFDLQEGGSREDDAMLAARTATLPLPTGAMIVLASPHHPDHGPVARSLAARGEGLFAITFAVDDLAGAVRTLRGRGLGVRVDEPDDVLVAAQLNHHQLHGARLGLVQAAH